MMRLTIGIVAVLSLSTIVSRAQIDTTKLHEAKMRMILAAVNFYSSDTKQPGHGVKCTSTIIAELKECAKPLSKVDTKIDKWDEVAVNTEASLRNLGATILADVTREKEYRKKLQGYGQFEQEVTELSNTKADLQSSPKPSPEPVPETPGNTPSPVSQGTRVQSQPAVVTDAPGVGLIWKDPATLSWAAIVIALIALIVAFISRGRKSNHRSGDTTGMRPVFSESGAEVNQTQTTISALQRQVSNLERELGTINTMIEDAERRLTEKLRLLESQQLTDLPKLEHGSASATHALQSKKWAKNVDGGGFELDALSSEPDSKMIYEITQTGLHTATFKVSEARDAQIFALTNPQNYLREGCNYTSQPSSNSQIRTEIPGTLELQGRKWRIINPAQIAFS